MGIHTDSRKDGQTEGEELSDPNILQYASQYNKWMKILESAVADPGIFVRGGPTFRKIMTSKKKKKQKTKKEREKEKTQDCGCSFPLSLLLCLICLYNTGERKKLTIR